MFTTRVPRPGILGNRPEHVLHPLSRPPWQRPRVNQCRSGIGRHGILAVVEGLELWHVVDVLVLCVHVVVAPVLCIHVFVLYEVGELGRHWCHAAGTVLDILMTVPVTVE